MNNQKFPRELAEQMFDQNVRFEAILHVPTLSVSHSVPEKFEDFLSSMDCNAGDLIEKHPQLKSLIESILEYTDRDWNEEHAQQLAFYCGDLEFLILVESSIPRNIEFDEKGEFRSCSIGGWYQLDWIFATDMKGAAEQAIKISEEIYEREEQKARKEQGLEG
ncbi:hypothetical protein B9T36_02080 [Acinetobacter sp. ANC 4204]|uniref:hypothetical protein n=1 Tax=Acinetobacter sp. ANC 4204 TaxID=1977884 RepID=UPI000A3301C1|nr:hypothetical protein [Acinetobacter sp. ANC 4204]OTG61212.1 hypothetical protein B9T36_02080 [Acinetobacter sp. ANC 4204]